MRPCEIVSVTEHSSPGERISTWESLPVDVPLKAIGSHSAVCHNVPLSM
jgi:hypothetical protein